LSDGSKKQWTNRRGAQPVSDLVSKLLDPVIERRAGMTMDLIASWEEIVGPNHAAKSRPEKLQWPRQAGEPGDENSFEPATLVVACDGGHALYLQHDSDAVLSQVNDYFGFSAVTRLKLVQKPFSTGGNPGVGLQAKSNRQNRSNNLASDQRSRLDDLVADIENDDLKNALEKLGRGVFSKGSSTNK